MTKVAVVTSVITYYRVNLFERLNKAEELDLLFMHGQDIKNSKFVNYRKPVSFKQKELWTLQYSKGTRFIKINPTLIWHLIRYNPDVLLLEGETNMLNNIGIYLYCRLFKKPFVWWGLGLIPGDVESLYQRLYRPMKRKMLEKAARIIGYSNYTKEDYSRFVSDPEKIVVSYNCLDNEKIDQEIARDLPALEEVRQALKLSGKTVLLYVGNLEAEKRVDKLLTAYQTLRRANPDLALLIVGKGTQLEHLKTLAGELRLEDVHFTGEIIENISRYFLVSDLFILPGRGGLAIHHAMVHGLPVISANADGTERDLITDDYNGFLLRTDTVEELTAKIAEFIRDKEQLKTMGRNSRHVVASKINVANMVNVFKTALEQSAKRPQ